FALAWPGVLLNVIFGTPAHVGQRADDEVLERSVALVEAPPHPAGERLHFIRRDVVEPFPCERAFAHPSNSDDIEDARLINRRVWLGYPIGQQVQLVLPSDQIARLQQRVWMSDVDLRRLGNIADVMKLSL